MIILAKFEVESQQPYQPIPANVRPIQGIQPIQPPIQPPIQTAPACKYFIKHFSLVNYLLKSYFICSETIIQKKKISVDNQ
jgi:hypothetical protein